MTQLGAAGTGGHQWLGSNSQGKDTDTECPDEIPYSANSVPQLRNLPPKNEHYH